jgi:hypothetical protein
MRAHTRVCAHCMHAAHTSTGAIILCPPLPCLQVPRKQDSPRQRHARKVAHRSRHWLKAYAQSVGTLPMCAAAAAAGELSCAGTWMKHTQTSWDGLPQYTTTNHPEAVPSLNSQARLLRLQTRQPQGSQGALMRATPSALLLSCAAV